MKSSLLVLVLVAVVGVYSAPAPAPEPAPAPAPAPVPNPDPSADDRPEIIEIIAPAASAQETLATLNLGAPGSELSERNKRTIGILRQLFPTLTQIIDQKVQQITGWVLQTFGPIFLRAFLGGNRSGGNNNGGGGTIELDDDDDDDDDVISTISTSTMSVIRTGSDNIDSGTIELNDDNDDIIATTAGGESLPRDNIGEGTNELDDDITATTTRGEILSGDNNIGDGNNDLDDDIIATTTTTSAPERRKRALYFLPTALAEENQLLSGAESQQAEVRVAFGEGQNQDQQVAASEDQQTAAQTAAIDEISLDDGDNSEADRNKRFLSFGGTGGGSGGGSGNFLFDIIRRPAESVARAAGSAFRLFAGTDSLNVGLTASHTATLDPNDPQLVAGSSTSSGEAAVDGEDAGGAKGDNLTEGVPGPITRLFIIANRGIANLIQDLILRIAQTSERIVNFKARLITSII